MGKESSFKILEFVGLALVLGLCLFGSSFAFSYQSFVAPVLQEISAALRSPEIQWMVFLCLAIYFTDFLFLRWRWENRLTQRRKGANQSAGTVRCAVWTSQRDDPTLWLAGGILISAVAYAIHYFPAIWAVTLLASAVVGQAFAVWKLAHLQTNRQDEFHESPTKIASANSGLRVTRPSEKIWASGARWNLETVVVAVLLIFLTFASIWKPNVGFTFEYQGHSRWSGPWGNPNVFGLLMGTGVALAMGMAVVAALYERRYSQNSNDHLSGGHRPPLQVRKYVCALLCLFAAIFLARGLLHSYSRGAWFATSCGLSYLLGFRLWASGSVGRRYEKNQPYPKAESGKRKAEISCDSWISWSRENWLLACVVLFSVTTLCFWHFQQTDWHAARRALSVVNPVDFSWRNRIAAWEGSLQIVAAHPWLGAGWNQPEPLFEHYYLPQKLTESAAIQMNDYLMLGAILGIPALFCFGMYIWLSLGAGNWKMGDRKSEMGDRQDACPISDWLQTTCRGGAITLLIGFWFDGGLFELATASTFWILLELGSLGNREMREIHENG